MSSQPTSEGYQLADLEIAAGRALDPVRLPRPSRPPRTGPPARQVLEDLVLTAMSGERSSVSFSGGRDSSLVLAVACAVARREGLELPVPVSMRHPSAMTDETQWQELVIRHLGLDDWVKVDIDDSMDALGEDATSLLGSTGVLAPPNAYLHLPVVTTAPAGTVLTGVGGDEILGTPGERLAQVLYHRLRPGRRDLLRLGLALAPRPVRARARRRRHLPGWSPWLRPHAAREVARRSAAAEVRPGIRWDVAAWDFARSRSALAGQHALTAVAQARGRRLASPLIAPDFVAAFGREVGPGGPRSRTASMHLLAGDLLPDAVLDRRSKAVFSAMVWGPRFRQFAAEWDPATLAPELAELVDARLLSRGWRSEEPPFASLMLAQHAWLSRQARLTEGLGLDPAQDGVELLPPARTGQLEHR